MNVLVTGAAGRLGSVVVGALCEGGYEVRATDRTMRMKMPVKIEPADLLDVYSCYRLVEGCEVLVHLGNHPGPGSLGGDMVRLYAENCTMTGNIMQCAAACGVKKIIYASSVQAITSGREWGEPMPPSGLPYLPLDGEVPARPGNSYALSKQAGENMLQYLVMRHNVQGIAVRFPFLMNEEAFTFCQKQPFQRYNRLDEAFAYLHIKDAAALVKTLLDTDLPGYRCYFPVGEGTVVRRPIAELIREFYPNVPLRKPLEEMEALVDISAITRECGWVPQRGLWG